MTSIVHDSNATEDAKSAATSALNPTPISGTPQQTAGPAFAAAAAVESAKHRACVLESMRMNNIAIRALTAGNVDVSFAYFRRALRPLIQRLREEAMAEEAQQQQATLSSPILPFSVADAERCLATSYPPFLRAVPSAVANAVSSLHSKPFALVEAAFVADPSEDSKIRFSVVCFNLALVFHLQGLVEQKQTTERLHKARSLYQNVYRLLVERIQQGPSGNAVVDMLFMAVLNNMAQLGQELADAALSRTALQKLLAVASHIQVTNYGDHRVSNWMEQHSRTFLLNVVAECFAPPMVAAAA